MEQVTEKLQVLVGILQANQDEIATLRSKAQALRDQLDAKQSDPDFTLLRQLPQGDDAQKLLALLKENRTLNQLIRQYESTMEVIMSKFRAQTISIQREKQSLLLAADESLERERAANRELREENLRLAEQLDESIHVIRLALRASDDGGELLGR